MLHKNIQLFFAVVKKNIYDTVMNYVSLKKLVLNINSLKFKAS